MNNKILELVEAIKKHDNVEKIILFGSLARGDADKYSDIDIVVIQKTDKRFIDRLLEFVNLPVSCDILVYTPEEFQNMLEQGNYFIKKVVSEGKILYEKQPCGS